MEIELQNHDKGDNGIFEKIKLFQCESESSGTDSYRITPIPCDNTMNKLENKRKSHKVPRGRRMTFQDDEFFYKQKSGSNGKF